MSKRVYPGYSLERQPTDYEKMLIDDYFDVQLVDFSNYKYTIVSAPTGPSSDNIVVVIQLKSDGVLDDDNRDKVLSVAEELLSSGIDGFIISRSLYTLDKFPTNSVAFAYKVVDNES